MNTLFRTCSSSDQSSLVLPLCLAMLFLLAAGCTDNKPITSSPPPPPDPMAASIDPGCNPSTETSLSSSDSSQTCVIFSYDASANLLSLTHTNAIFNCCPYQISFDVTLEGSQLTISESEDSSLCRCICPFDVEFAVTDLTPGDYQITILEQYFYFFPGADSIKFDLSLTSDTSGTIRFSRDPGIDSTDGKLLKRQLLSDLPKVYPKAASVDPGACNPFTETSLPYSDSSQTCIIFNYDASANLLSVTHTNVIFNCCPFQISFDVELVGNQLTIREYEDSSLCDCICAFDMEFSVRNLVPGFYHIVIQEQYQPPDIEAINFDLSLTGDTNGTICFPRNPDADSTSGTLLSYTGCKDTPGTQQLRPDRVASMMQLDTTANFSCIAYSYDGTNLTLDHINAGFNCCPDNLHAEFDFNGSHIRITESESFVNGGCYCLCLFDLAMVIEGLDPGTYSFAFDEVCWNDPEGALEFYLDLTTATQGIVCVERNVYPWGILEN